MDEQQETIGIDPELLEQMDEVKRILDTAAKAIMAMPIEEWAGWFTYLMETVETDGLIGFDFVLEVERERINNRLETGRW